MGSQGFFVARDRGGDATGSVGGSGGDTWRASVAWRSGSAPIEDSDLSEAGMGADTRDFGGGTLAKAIVGEGPRPKVCGFRVLERPLVNNRDDRFVAGGTGRYVGDDKARGSEGIGLGAEVGEMGQGVVAPGVGLLCFGPVVSRVEITRGPLHEEAGEQSGIVCGEIVFQGEFHGCERIALGQGQAPALELDAGRDGGLGGRGGRNDGRGGGAGKG